METVTFKGITFYSLDGVVECGEGYYISKCGMVLSTKWNRLKILKGIKHKFGYLYIHLHQNKKTKSYRIHRLVALKFLPNLNNLPEVNHIDENKENNDISNLEWCDEKYNNNYGTRIERVVESLKGSKSPNFKGWVKVTDIKTGELIGIFEGIHDTWRNLKSVKKKQLITSCISQCLNGIRNSHGGYHYEYISEEEYIEYKKTRN